MRKNMLFLIIIIVLLASSCSRYEELNNLSIISNIEIKYQDKKYVVIMQEVTPKKNDNNLSYVYTYRTGRSKNLKKAFDNIIDHSPKKIYLKKVQNIVIQNSNKDVIISEYLKNYKYFSILNSDSSIIISDNSLKKIMKINNDYRYIESILKNKKISYKEVLKKYKKNKRNKLPLLNINNNELEFKKYIYLHVYSSAS